MWLIPAAFVLRDSLICLTVIPGRIRQLWSGKEPGHAKLVSPILSHIICELNDFRKPPPLKIVNFLFK